MAKSTAVYWRNSLLEEQSLGRDFESWATIGKVHGRNAVDKSLGCTLEQPQMFRSGQKLGGDNMTSNRSIATIGFIYILQGASRVPSPGATAVRTRAARVMHRHTAARACSTRRCTCAVHWQLLTSCGAGHGVGGRLVWRRRRLLRIRLDEAPLPRSRVASVRCGRLFSSTGTGLTRAGPTGLPRLRFPKAPPFPHRLPASTRISVPCFFTKTSAALSSLVSVSCITLDVIAIATAMDGFSIPVQMLPCT